MEGHVNRVTAAHTDETAPSTHFMLGWVGFVASVRGKFHILRMTLAVLTLGIPSGSDHVGCAMALLADCYV